MWCGCTKCVLRTYKVCVADVHMCVAEVQNVCCGRAKCVAEVHSVLNVKHVPVYIHFSAPYRRHHLCVNIRQCHLKEFYW